MKTLAITILLGLGFVLAGCGNSSKSGNKVTYKMACTGEEATTVNGEITYAANSYEGRNQMTTKSGGDTVSMQQTFAGKRVGDCTAK